VTLRLRAIVKSAEAGSGRMDHVGTAAPGRPGQAKLDSPATLEAPVLFDGKKLKTAVYSRDALKPGKKYSGPAIVTEYSATTVIPPKSCFHLDSAANLIVTIR